MKIKNRMFVVFFIAASLFQVMATKPITYLFSHGFADSYRQGYKYVKKYTWCGMEYRNKYYIIDGEVKTFNYPDALIKPFTNIFRTSLGQDSEIAVLQKEYKKIEDDVVLIGVSRGAAAALNFLAESEVKAAVLEAPFDHVETVFDFCWYAQLMNNVLCAGKKGCLHRFFEKVSCYEKDGRQPIALVEKIRKDLPILIICSEIDNTIPFTASINLYKKLCKTGHDHAYLFKLKEGKHAKLLWGKDGERYQNVVHAFYKKYGLPHNDEFAQKGASDFKRCRPGFDELDMDIEENRLKSSQDGFVVRYKKWLQGRFSDSYSAIKSKMQKISDRLLVSKEHGD